MWCPSGLPPLARYETLGEYVDNVETLPRPVVGVWVRHGSYIARRKGPPQTSVPMIEWHHPHPWPYLVQGIWGQDPLIPKLFPRFAPAHPGPPPGLWNTGRVKM